jgi:PAS domain S-box-containing protein
MLAPLGIATFLLQWYLLKRASKNFVKKEFFQKMLRDADMSGKMLIRRDIELTRTNEKLLEQSEYSKILLESIGDGIVISDKGGKVVTLNNSAEEMLGWKERDIIGKILSETIPFEDDSGKPLSKENTASFESMCSIEKVTGTYTFMQKGDGKLSVLVTCTPIIFQGNLAGTIEVLHDVTKEKEVEQAKNEFVSLASHQLRTPPSSIRWHSEELLSEEIGSINEKQRHYIEKILSASQRMVKIIDMFLNISRIEVGNLELHLENVELSAICKEALDDLSSVIAEKKLFVETHAEEGLPAMKTDKNALLIAFQNMLSNAVKYTPHGGSIKINLAKDGKDGENALVKISDTGYGIPKKDQPRIFTKLFRAGNVSEKETDGNGLGLYLTKSIIELLGGAIWFESEENNGSTFFFRLPFTK